MRRLVAARAKGAKGYILALALRLPLWAEPASGWQGPVAEYIARHINKGYGKEWVAGYTGGFQSGWTQVCDQGAQAARKERRDDEDSSEERP